MASRTRGPHPSLLLLLHLSLLLHVSLLLFACPPSWALQRNRGMRVRELTDKSFEHDTQASTGQTTGRWLVLFVGSELDEPELDKPLVHDTDEDSSAGIAESAAAAAEKGQEGASRSGLSSADIIRSIMLIASEQESREFIPATVHVGRSPGVAKRFQVSATPVLMLLRDRRMYTFPGTPSSTAELRDFIQGGYSSLEAQEVPSEPTFWHELMAELPDRYQNFKHELASRPWVLLLFSLAVGVFFYALCASLLGFISRSKRKAPQRGAVQARNKKQP